MITLDAVTFRELFPEFRDVAAYTDPMVELWLEIAGKLHDADRWGNLIDYGAGLFVAHNLALSAMDGRAAAAGGAPGQAASGIVSSKSVDKVSVSYDTSGAAEAGMGAWNLTSYGTRYIRLVNLIGIGPIQVGASPVIQSAAAGAWTGPGMWPV